MEPTGGWGSTHDLICSRPSSASRQIRALPNTSQSCVSTQESHLSVQGLVNHQTSPLFKIKPLESGEFQFPSSNRLGMQAFQILVRKTVTYCKQIQFVTNTNTIPQPYIKQAPGGSSHSLAVHLIKNRFFLHYGKFKKPYILDHLRIFTFWTIPEL